METIKAIENIVTTSGKSKRAISTEMGRSGNYLASVMEQSQRKGGGVNTSTLAGIAAACGYELALIPAGAAPEGAIVIDAPSK